MQRNHEAKVAKHFYYGHKLSALTQRRNIQRNDILLFNKVSFLVIWLVFLSSIMGKQASADIKYLK